MTKYNFKKGHTPWNKGMKGFVTNESFKKGRIVPKSIREAISKGNKGKIRSKEYKENLKGKHNSIQTEIKKGYHLSKITEFKKGHMPWNKEVNEKKVRELYNSGESINNISNKFNCHFGTIYKILKKNKIKLRDRLNGENSPNWLGGKSFEPYDKTFNLKFKNQIRKRDNQVCMMCGIHREKINQALNIHHINYDKLLSIPQNCISLCKSCHVKTNYNRKYWIKFFQSLLLDKYNYNYLNEEIIIKVGGKICSGV